MYENREFGAPPPIFTPPPNPFNQSHHSTNVQSSDPLKKLVATPVVFLLSYHFLQKINPSQYQRLISLTI